MKAFSILAVPIICLSACSSSPSHQQLLDDYLQLSANSHGVADLELHFMPVLSGKALTGAVVAARYLQQADLAQTGVASAEISFQDETSVDFCLDVSGTRLLDQSGVDLTPSDRPLRLPMSASLSSSWGKFSIEQLLLREVASC